MRWGHLKKGNDWGREYYEYSDLDRGHKPCHHVEHAICFEEWEIVTFRFEGLIYSLPILHRFIETKVTKCSKVPIGYHYPELWWEKRTLRVSLSIVEVDLDLYTKERRCPGTIP